MALTARAHSAAGSLRQEILVDGRHRLVTDQPFDHGGEGTGPSPHELFPAALAGCIAFTLARYGRTKGWELGEIDVDVEYDHKATPRTFDIVIRIAGQLDAVQLARLEKVAAACPLRHSIEAGVEFTTRLDRDRSDDVEAAAEAFAPLLRRESAVEERDELVDHQLGAEAT